MRHWRLSKGSQRHEERQGQAQHGDDPGTYWFHLMESLPRVETGFVRSRSMASIVL
jgi:hypothetical protein